VWQGNRLQELTAAFEEASSELESVQEVNRILDVRIDEAFSLERIARLARERLGMSEPTVIRYVRKPTADTD
jgi:predicted transcriptional regulator YheO